MTTKVSPVMLESLSTLLDAVLPVGALVPYAGANAPGTTVVGETTVELAFAYGQAVSRTTYATLFQRVGTAFGAGNGTTTFNLPDYRGRVIVGQDDMGGAAANRVTAAISGIDAATLGASGGDQRMQQHTHAITDPGHSHPYDQGTGGTGGAPSANLSATLVGGTQSAVTGITIQDAGAGGAQNMPPAQVANVLIRLR